MVKERNVLQFVKIQNFFHDIILFNKILYNHVCTYLSTVYIIRGLQHADENYPL